MGFAVEAVVVTALVVVAGYDDEYAEAGVGAPPAAGVAGFEVAGDAVGAPQDGALAAGTDCCCCCGCMPPGWLLAGDCGCVELCEAWAMLLTTALNAAELMEEFQVDG